MVARQISIILSAIVCLCLIICIAVPYLYLIRTAKYSVKFQTARHQRILLSDYTDKLKSGDILLFIARTHSPTTSISVMLFSHAAMVVEIGGVLFISESQTGTEYMPGILMMPGTVLTPLLTRLKYYCGSVFLMQLSKPLDDARKHLLLQAADRFNKYPSPYDIVSSVCLSKTSPNRHCFQHVAFLIDSMKLSQEPLEPSGTIGVCHAVGNLNRNISLVDGYTYGPILEILFDLDTV